MDKRKELAKRRKVIKRKKKNVKMFPFYRMVSWDFLFYYPIIFLFLTQVKGFDASQVLLADAIYTIASTILQLPLTIVVERIGKKHCLLIGNVLYTLSALIIISLTNYYQLVIAQIVYAIGYSMKQLCENNILYDSLPANVKRGKLFSKIEAKASSNYFYFDAISSVIAGIAFSVNGYIPMYLCFATCLIATIMTFKFNHTTPPEEKKNIKPVSVKTYFGDLKETFTFFKKSRRVKSLFIFNAIFMAILIGVVNLRSSMLKEMQVPEVWFGIIFAFLQIGAAILARYQDRIQKKLKNKTLTVLSLPVAVSCILIGFVGKDGFSVSSMILIIILYFIQQSVKGPYMGLISRYLNNFTSKKIRAKISAFKNLTANLAIAIFTTMCSILLKVTTTSNTFIIVGCISTIAIVLVLDFMRDKVGLEPEYYTDEDVKYSIRKPKKTKKVEKENDKSKKMS